MSTKISVHNGNVHKKLSKKEREIFKLLKEGLTQSKISKLLGCSRQNVSNYVSKLRSLGLIDNYNLCTQKAQVDKGGCPKVVNKIRLHNEHWVITFTGSKPNKYNDHYLGKRVTIESNVVVYNKNNIEIYSNNSFYASSPSKAEAMSLNYWFKFIRRLERNLNCVLIKDKYLNIKRVNSHYAETGSTPSKLFKKENQSVRIVGEDGKTTFVFDDSFNLAESEAVHPVTSKFDMENVFQPFMSDLRTQVTKTNESVKISDLIKLMGSLAIENKQMKEEVLLLTKSVIQTQEQLKLFIQSQTMKQEVSLETKKEKMWYVG